MLLSTATVHTLFCEDVGGLFLVKKTQRTAIVTCPCPHSKGCQHLVNPSLGPPAPPRARHRKMPMPSKGCRHHVLNSSLLPVRPPFHLSNASQQKLKAGASGRQRQLPGAPPEVGQDAGPGVRKLHPAGQHRAGAGEGPPGVVTESRRRAVRAPTAPPAGRVRKLQQLFRDRKVRGGGRRVGVVVRWGGGGG